MGLQPHTLADVLRGSPDNSAVLVTKGGPSFTRQQLEALTWKVADRLRELGIRPGDLISIAETNTIEFVIAFIGVTLARAVAAPLNSAYRPDEFEFFLEDASSKLLLVPSKGNSNAEKAAQKLGVPTASMQLSGKDLEIKPKAGGNSQRPSLGAAKQDPPKPEDVALFLHTSGTTSRPKGVPLNHGNLSASLSNIIGTYEMQPSDRSLLVMPLFHVHGLMAGCLAPLAAGGSVILPAEGRFAATSFWHDAGTYQATFYTAVPTIHQILLQRAEKDFPKDNPPPFRFIRSCSSALPAPVMKRLEEAFNVPVLEAYAMTEASHQMTANPLPKNGPHKPGSVGRPQGSVRVAILDSNAKPVPQGKIGEVCALGPNITKGYLNRPEANEEAFAGGWFHTGDQGYLDKDGYVILTGRIKELINRGGEKISPVEVDDALLTHPDVREAVAFAAPDEKFGEAVAAVVVLNSQPADAAKAIADIKRHVGQRISKFKVPEQLFISDSIPKGATGKIQRRNMVAAFIKKDGESGSANRGGQASSSSKPSSSKPSSEYINGFAVVARALYALGVRQIYGVIGIPVTELASAAQAVGIRYIGFHNEQAAGYAAAAAGFQTGFPGILLTVSGPGAVHGLAGLSHAMINGWPMVMLSGSAERNEIGKGSFQELDQVSAVTMYTKWRGAPNSVAAIPGSLQSALQATLTGKPGAAYVDLASDLLFAAAPSSDVSLDLPPVQSILTREASARPSASRQDVQQAARLLKQARRPLVVVGKGAAISGAEAGLQQLISKSGIPFLATNMGRGVVPDSHQGNCNAARSSALAGADVAIIFGARLNWQLHFGETPKWSSGVKFILVDVEPSWRDSRKATHVLKGDAQAVAAQLLQAWGSASLSSEASQWASNIRQKAAANKAKLEKRLEPTAYPLDFSTALRVVRDSLSAIHPAPVVVSEGANTMDNARVILEPVEEGRLRMDAGTWGTMGVGLGCAVGAAATRPDRLVVAVEGDSAFGFSGMEIETIVRYKLPIVIIIMNNSGIYGGDRRQPELQAAAARGMKAGNFGSDPEPTAFVPSARYDKMMEAFGGESYITASASQLAAACRISFAAKRPALINCIIDPMAGVESGNVHSFNAPKAKL